MVGVEFVCFFVAYFLLNVSLMLLYFYDFRLGHLAV